MSHRRAKLTEQEAREQNLNRATPEQRRSRLVAFVRDEWVNAWIFQRFHNLAQGLVAKADDEEVMAVLVQKAGNNRFSTLKALLDAHPDEPVKQPAEEPDRKGD